jgi:hypothetical protein
MPYTYVIFLKKITQVSINVSKTLKTYFFEFLKRVYLDPSPPNLDWENLCPAIVSLLEVFVV